MNSPGHGGAHGYAAYERADAVFYGVTVEGLTPATARTYGRVADRDDDEQPRADGPKRRARVGRSR